MRAKNQLPLVLCSWYEHHSNEVTWRKQLCDSQEIPNDKYGDLDLIALEKVLKQNKHRKVIGSFSAGSNVTGQKSDTFAIAKILKKYNCLCFFDYAAVGPYVNIDLGKRLKDGRTLIDGIYISPHKFLGGPGTCGVLVISKDVYNGKLSPTHGGGGTVEYVSENTVEYTPDPNHREKSGTPGIAQIIKCGLVFQLKGIC
jgi:selenocysteine lyase/cysteine desulfurase